MHIATGKLQSLAGNFFAFRAKATFLARLRRLLAARARFLLLRAFLAWGELVLASQENVSGVNINSMVDICAKSARARILRGAWNALVLTWLLRKRLGCIYNQIIGRGSTYTQHRCMRRWLVYTHARKRLRNVLRTLSSKTRALAAGGALRLWHVEVVKRRLRWRAGRRVLVRWSKLLVKKAVDKWMEVWVYCRWRNENVKMGVRMLRRRLLAACLDR